MTRKRPDHAPATKTTGRPKARSKPKPTGEGARMVPPAEGVKVRMYRTGLGDCFLLAFPAGKIRAGGARHGFYLLVDCGVYRGTPEPGNTTRMKAIVSDIRAATGGKIDLLMITHEHWDHVSGFHKSQTQDEFARIDLAQLWLPWTEDEQDPLAQQLRAGRQAGRAALKNALNRMSGLTGAAESQTSALIRKVLEFFGDSHGPEAEAGTAPPATALASDDDRPPPTSATPAAVGSQDLTGEAMDWIKGTYGKGKTKYVRPGDGPIPLDGVDSARIYILGPPEDAALIKKCNPSASGDEVYPRAMSAAIEAAFFAAFGVVPAGPDRPTEDDVEDARRICMPFDSRRSVTLADAKAGDPDTFYRKHYLDAAPWRCIEGDWLESAGEFALKLDSATNNTSLAFALEIGPPGEGKVLLFPGDAQVGNWLSWFGKVAIRGREFGKDMAWRAGSRTVTAEDLLRRTVLYKVGHHGSHNATLRGQGLEFMGPPLGSPELVAMIPVNEHVARVSAGYGEMPLRSLVKDLLIRTNGHVARNDEGAEIDADDDSGTLGPIPGAPDRDPSFATGTPLYFDYVVTPPK